MTLVGPNGGAISNSHTGSIFMPQSGLYRILIYGGQVIASLTVGELPGSCCDEGGPPCLNVDLVSSGINITGATIAGLNGLYILQYRPLFFVPRWGASRKIINGETGTIAASCKFLGGYSVPQQYSWEYTWARQCTVYRDPTRGGGDGITAGWWGLVGLDILVQQGLYRCGHDITVRYTLQGTTTHFVEGLNVICGGGMSSDGVVVEREDIGCLETGQIVDIDLSQSPFNSQYDESYLNSCIWAGFCACGGGGIF